jgi:probable rRNA maturation factor
VQRFRLEAKEPYAWAVLAKVEKKGVQWGLQMIEVNNTTKGHIDEAFLKTAAKTVLKREGIQETGLSIALVGPKRMRELTKAYHGKDAVANVLSFPEPEFGLGEIVICPAEVKKDAKKYGILIKEAMAWMLIHGILHLVGYHHENDNREARKMEEREEQHLSFVRTHL